jgi:hypothetical protein
MSWVLATALGALPLVSAHAASYGLAFDGFKVSVVDLDPADGIAAGYDVIGQTMAYSAILGDSEAGFSSSSSSASGNGFVPFEPFDQTASLRGASGRVRVAEDSFSLQATESGTLPTDVWLELVIRNVYELRPNTQLDVTGTWLAHNDSNPARQGVLLGTSTHQPEQNTLHQLFLTAPVDVSQPAHLSFSSGSVPSEANFALELYVRGGPNLIPETQTYVLMLVGLAALGVWVRRKR